MRPRAKTKGMIVAALGDEVIIYDQERQAAHTMSQRVHDVWLACDGTKSPSELSAEQGATEPDVLEALQALADAHLLQEEPSSGAVRYSRRGALAQAGVVVFGGALALPLIQSIVAPNIAAASVSGHLPPP